MQIFKLYTSIYKANIFSNLHLMYRGKMYRIRTSMFENGHDMDSS